MKKTSGRRAPRRRGTSARLAASEVAHGGRARTAASARACARSTKTNARQRDRGDHERPPDVAEAPVGALDQAVRERAEADGGEQPRPGGPAAPREAARCSSQRPSSAARTTAAAASGRLRKKIQRHDDPLGQRAADRRPGDRRDARERRPEPDRAARRRRRRRREAGRASSWSGTRRRRPAARARRSAARRSAPRPRGPTSRRSRRARDERRPAPVAVADRAAGEVEGGEGERVREEDPLLAREAEVEVALDRRAARRSRPSRR